MTYILEKVRRIAHSGPGRVEMSTSGKTVASLNGSRFTIYFNGDQTRNHGCIFVLKYDPDFLELRWCYVSDITQAKNIQPC